MRAFFNIILIYAGGKAEVGNKAIIYLRVSTDMQTEESQLEPCKNLCKEKNYEVIGIVKDHSRSAYKNVKRPGYDKIMDMVKNREMSHIVVWALDRWTRKGSQELKNNIDYLQGYDVQLHSVQEQWIESINMPGGMGQLFKDFFIGLSGWLAQEESKKLSERIKGSEKFQKAKKKGKLGRSTLPAEVVKEVLKKLEEGKSYRQVHREVTYKAKHGKIKNVSVGKVAEIANLRSKNAIENLTKKKV
jgi:DNA invertase Pin-like site-specific DNA recombinase